MDDEKYAYSHIFKPDTKEQAEYFGKGHAKIGYKNEYQTYDPSPVYERLKDRDRVWNAFSLLTPQQFQGLVEECEPLWPLSRTSDQQRNEKH